METTVSNLFFSLVQEYGVGGGIMITASVIALAFALSQFLKWVSMTALGFWQRKTHPGKLLLKHECFAKLDHIVSHRLNNIQVKCIIRKRLYQDIMKERISCISEALKELVKDDIFSLSSSELFYHIEAAFDDSNTKARSKLVADGIPDFLLEAMNDKIKLSWEFEKKHIKHCCYGGYLYKNNYDRMYQVLNITSTMIENYMNTLESTLGEFNGDIKELEYKGVTCAGCTSCIHEEYLKEIKRELIDENVLPEEAK